MKEDVKRQLLKNVPKKRFVSQSSLEGEKTSMQSRLLDTALNRSYAFHRLFLLNCSMRSFTGNERTYHVPSIAQ